MLGLPTDRPRGAERPGLSAVEACALDPGLAADTTLLWGFAAVLSRYTGSAEIDLRFGGDLMAYCDLRGDATFAGHAGRIRITSDGDPSSAVMFATGAADLSDSPVELACLVTDREVSLAYDARLFDRSTIRRLGAHLRILVADGLAHPDREVRRLELLAPDERALLVGEWARNDRPLDLSRSIVELFERQAERTPDAVAFVFKEGTLTFAQLRERSAATARGLIAAGVGPGGVVGVYLSRTLDYPVAMLGTLRAGAACLPLAPDYPAEALRWILTDAAPRIVITGPGAAADLADTPVSELAALELAGRGRDELPRTGPDDLMYVIYTSGSTGRPKGVEVTHRVALNRLAWMWREYPFAPGEVCSQRTPANFVDSFWELFGPLLRGVPTVIVPGANPPDPVAFIELLAAHGITRTWVVPTILREMLDAWPELAAKLPRLTFWVSIGEALPVELLRRFEREMPHATLFNVYGASEIWDATWWDPRGHRDDLWRAPIGRPIDNVRVRVVDRNLELVPIGVPGELLVGGVGLARGYLGRPDLTAERFVEDPLAPGSRLYRTGDLVRFLAGGELEYIGRIDRQAQICGCRVEPAEVEALLLDHPDIADAAVTLDTTGPAAVLAAYAVARPGRSVAGADVRTHMRRVAPWYMCPGAFVTVASIPRTHSGKIDHRALPPIVAA